jgi:hypothetical protein
MVPQDANGNLDWLFEEHGKVGIKNKGELPPKHNLMLYKTPKHMPKKLMTTFNGKAAHRNIRQH